jgi:hypothetical protein
VFLSLLLLYPKENVLCFWSIDTRPFLCSFDPDTNSTWGDFFKELKFILSARITLSGDTLVGD